jgi:hypothetical protein
MRMSKSYLMYAQALSWMLVFQPAHAVEVHGIRIGDQWDADRLEEAMSYVTVPAAQRVKCSRAGAENCAGSTRYLAVDVRLTIEGENGRVKKITMTLPADRFDDEIAALKHEIGEPTNEWSSAPGATAPLPFHHRVDWRLANEELFALKFSAMATISLTRPEDSVSSRYPPPD